MVNLSLEKCGIAVSEGGHVALLPSRRIALCFMLPESYVPNKNNGKLANHGISLLGICPNCYIWKQLCVGFYSYTLIN